MSEILKVNPQVIKDQLTFIYSGMGAYDDGRFEVGGLVSANTQNFDLTKIDDAVAKIEKLNNSGVNGYYIPALLLPETVPFGRASDEDVYATSVLWVDIDDKHDKEALKALYAHCPPNMAVITATVPHRRIHLYWKLDEPLTDHDTLREALAGVIQALGGDPAAVNPSRLMRLAGTVNRPNAKKCAEGRIDENVTLHFLNKDSRVSIEQFMAAYPVKDYAKMNESIDKDNISKNAYINPFSQPLVDDGRDAYMSKMVFAAIVSLTQEKKAWPTPQEVFDDVWPIYSVKAAPRAGRTLEQDGRGQSVLAQKVRSKLRQFTKGGMARYGFSTLEETVAKKQNKQEEKKGETAQPINDETVSPSKNDIKFKEPKTLPLLFASDIQTNIETNDFVQGLLCEQQFSVIYGQSNCGKTFFMLDLAMHVALGMKWRDKEVEQGGVIYAALEGGHGTKNRIVAFKQHYKIDKDIPLAVIPSNINFLDNENDLPALVAAIQKAQERIGNVKLIVIDTFSRAMSGGDENSSVDMGKMIIAADMIRALTKAHISFIHHSGKDDIRGARGHSSLRAAVDTEIEISRPDEVSPSKMSVVKQREMEMVEDLGFSLYRVVLGADKRNNEVSSCIVLASEAVEEKNMTKMSNAEKFVYDAIVQAIINVGQSRSVYKDTPPVMCVDYFQLAQSLEEMGYKDLFKEDGTHAANQATLAARMGLKKKGFIGFNRKYLWINKELDESAN